MNRSRAVASLLGFTIIVSCGGSSASTETTTSTTTSTTSTTATTLAPLVSNLDIRIDPAAADLPQVSTVLESLERIERKYPVRPGTVVILYTNTEPSITWVRQTTRDLSCFDDEDVAYFRVALGQGRGCGLLLRLDKLPVCEATTWCKEWAFIAAHEYFHIITSNRLGSQDNRLAKYYRSVPTWMHEGTADYVGYSFTYAENPGQLSSPELSKFHSEIRTLAMDPNVNVSIDKLSGLWVRDRSKLAPRWLLYAYHRAFLVVSLLIEKFGEQAVLVDYFMNMAATGDHNSAFETTFGITEPDFNIEFQQWIEML